MQERSFEVIDFDHTQRTRCHAKRYLIKILSPWFYGLYIQKYHRSSKNVFKSPLRRTFHKKKNRIAKTLWHIDKKADLKIGFLTNM